MKAANVFYDPQEDSYFKVDKSTGESLRVHRNGSELTRFKPEYSGSDYHTRRSVQKELSPPSLVRPPFQVKLEHRHTENLKLKNQHKSKSHAALAPISLRPVDVEKETQYASPLKKGENEFEEKLKQFSMLKEKLRNENHSPKHGIEGSIVQEAAVKGVIHFLEKSRAQGAGEKKKGKQAKSTSALGLLEMPDSLVLKNQVRREREIFLKYNGQFAAQANQRQEREMRERKTNLKILEKLQLEKSERATNQVYC